MQIFGKNLKDDLAVIAEIGVNHQGNVSYAKELIRLAASAGADAVKFQSYTPERYASKENIERFERVKCFAFSEMEHLELIAEAKANGIEFFSTPLSEDWVPFLDEHTNVFKIASGDITFEPVVRSVAAANKPFIVSTGAANIEEIDQLVEWVVDEIGLELSRSNLILMHCICSYPAPIEQANVRSVAYLKERYGLEVGFSNHIIEQEACLAAVALGSNIIEVHFTDNKTGREFHDHALSFEPQELESFIKSASLIKSSLGNFSKTVQPCEENNVPNVRKGIVAAKDLSAGHIITKNDIFFCRPALPLSAADLPSLIGKTLERDISAGHTIKPENFR
tara:strand:+ start:29 stop:1039 length:1011 start_codon:yes stop_codon:yes gene_type:complete